MMRRFVLATLIFLFGCCGFAFGQNVPDTAAPGAGQPVADDAAQMTDIYDIKPPIPPAFDPTILYYALGAVIALALIILALRLWRKRRNRLMMEEFQKLSPEELADRSLDEIMDIELQEGKEFYFKLSAILRTYVKGRFGFNASEMTTEELLPKIGELDILRELKQGVRDLCRSSDAVKFAGFIPVQSKMQKDLNFVRIFVKQTTVKPETAQTNEKVNHMPVENSTTSR